MAKTVAVIGASSHRHKFGNRAVRAFVREGYHVIPINPHEVEVEGLKAFASVLDVPGPIDMATVYVQPDTALRLLDEFQRKRIPEIWLNPGADDDDVLAEARKRRLNVIAACSIIGAGKSPGDY
jgi:predicted CoA-binding protein